MANDNQPLLNPVLSLRIDPKPVDPTTGGKSRAQINRGRLPVQRNVLQQQFGQLHTRAESERKYNGLLPVAVEMYDDAFAPSKIPGDFFGRNAEARIITPLPNGYLVEVREEKLYDLSEAAVTDDTVAGQVDISNIKSVNFFDATEISRRSLEDVWEHSQAVDGGKIIRLMFLPYRDRAARRELMEHLDEQVNEGLFKPIDLRHKTPEPAIVDRGSSLADGKRSYRNSSRGQATVIVENLESLRALCASSTVFRLDAVSKITATSPGTGAEPVPDPDTPAAFDYPIVGVIDGGLTARRYKNQIAWTATPYVAGVDADTVHGNEIASMVIQGYEWNNNLQLPELNCRIGVAQAIAKENCQTVYTDDSFLIYLKWLLKDHPEVKVWNMSFNQQIVCEEDEFSDLGHRIGQLARENNVLPIISIGNKSTGPNRMYPPADCEAGITVSGRAPDTHGAPDQPCSVSREGPGPQGVLKPELSSFSNMRVIGGNIRNGSSYAVTPTSVLAAHTFDQLKDPTPDLVKALMINKSDIGTFCLNRGWGTPSTDVLPWMCPTGSVTLAWTEELQAGKAYYWEDIPITSNMIKDGGLYGKAVLTAILNPHRMVTQGSGANYFSCRVEVALQYKNAQNNTKSLLGPMKLSEMPEHLARTDHDKWNPIRHYSRDFTNRPMGYTGNSFKLYARVFARDLYLYNLERNEDVPPLPVAFVLTLQSVNPDPNISLYNEMTGSLGSFVESAVVDQDIEIDL